MSAQPTEWKMFRRIVVLAVVLGCAAAILLTAYERHDLTVGGDSAPALATAPQPRDIGIPALGMDYVAPNSYFRACPDWTWLETRCFDPSRPPPASAGEPGLTVLRSDLHFVRTAGLGRFMRVWASANQLFRIGDQGQFLGLRSARMRNLDRALAVFHRDHLEVDLVMFTYTKGGHTMNQFNPQAIDGNHAFLRFSYLRGLRQIIRHLADNRIDAATVKVIDLQNEAYYQLEQYFDTPSHLGLFGDCLAGDGDVSSHCVDQRIIHHWLIALYRTARLASRHFLYTISDTGRLLSTNPAQQSYWMHMYPVDVYDIHLYDNRPWLDEARLATALHLRKPWFSGEAGCASGDAGCTYSGTESEPVDRWWLLNVGFRAQSVMIESKDTLWYYRYANPSQTLTDTGLALECQARPELTRCGRL